MDNYIKYNCSEIGDLNKTKVWSRTPIEIKEQSDKKPKVYSSCHRRLRFKRTNIYCSSYKL